MNDDIISPRLADEAILYMAKHNLRGEDAWTTALAACRRIEDVVERAQECGEKFIDEQTSERALHYMRQHGYTGEGAFTRALRDMQRGQQ